jgi:hypothetical protein
MVVRDAGVRWLQFARERHRLRRRCIVNQDKKVYHVLEQSVPTTSYPALTILKAMAEPIAPRPITPTFFVMLAIPDRYCISHRMSCKFETLRSDRQCQDRVDTVEKVGFAVGLLLFGNLSAA